MRANWALNVLDLNYNLLVLTLARTQTIAYEVLRLSILVLARCHVELWVLLLAPQWSLLGALGVPGSGGGLVIVALPLRLRLWLVLALEATRAVYRHVGHRALVCVTALLCHNWPRGVVGVHLVVLGGTRRRNQTNIGLGLELDVALVQL